MSDDSKKLNQQPDEADCAAVEELIPAYCLGAADADERQWVESQLADCPEAATELAQYAALTGALLFSAPQVTPPPHLEAKLMAAAAPQAKPVDAPAGLWTRLQALLLGRRRAFALAGLALVLLVVSNVYWITQVNDLNATIAANAAEHDELLELLKARDANRVELASTQNNSAQVHVTWSPAVQDTGLLEAQNLPALSPGMTYQLWLKRGDYRISGGLFTVDENGDGILIFHTSEPISSFETMGITPEPAGGSPGPTSPPVVAGQI